MRCWLTKLAKHGCFYEIGVTTGDPMKVYGDDDQGSDEGVALRDPQCWALLSTGNGFACRECPFGEGADAGTGVGGSLTRGADGTQASALISYLLR